MIRCPMCMDTIGKNIRQTAFNVSRPRQAQLLAFFDRAVARVTFETWGDRARHFVEVDGWVEHKRTTS